MRKTDWGEGVRTMRTSIEMPEDVWEAAKIHAAKERINLQDVITAALRDYLKLKKREVKKNAR